MEGAILILIIAKVIMESGIDFSYALRGKPTRRHEFRMAKLAKSGTAPSRGGPVGRYFGALWRDSWDSAHHKHDLNHAARKQARSGGSAGSAGPVRSVGATRPAGRPTPRVVPSSRPRPAAATEVATGRPGTDHPEPTVAPGNGWMLMTQKPGEDMSEHHVEGDQVGLRMKQAEEDKQAGRLTEYGLRAATADEASAARNPAPDHLATVHPITKGTAMSASTVDAETTTLDSIREFCKAMAEASADNMQKCETAISSAESVNFSGAPIDKLNECMESLQATAEQFKEAYDLFEPHVHVQESHELVDHKVADAAAYEG